MKSDRFVPSIAFLSTYPPTSCGLATFTAALRGAIADGRGSEDGLDVVSLVDRRLGEHRPEVAHEHVTGDTASLARALTTLNTSDAVFVQHEYGIYGGPDGDEVLGLLAGLEVPAIVTLHTVLSQPSRGQRSVLEKVVALAERTIVMTDTAKRRLIDGYQVDPTKVRVVAHGASTSFGGPSLAKGPRPVVLTWGLIGPGKGLEIAIDSFAGLRDLRPLPRYVILGVTHPKVRAAQGDAYLEGLAARVHDLGLDDVVEFDGRYLSLDALALEVRRANLVLLPYESTEQVTSGVLVEAIAAGKPVVATAFPHAVELLGTGNAGMVVPHENREAMTSALRTILIQPALAAGMAAEARSIGSALYWPTIARRYLGIAGNGIDRHRADRALPRATRSPKGLDAFAKVG